MKEVNLVDQPVVQKWLSQFSEHDRQTAINLVQSLRLISFQEIERAIQQELEKFAKLHSGKIALFPVRKPVTRPVLSFWKRLFISFAEMAQIGKVHILGERDTRPRHGSDGRFGHLLVALERRMPRRFAVEPTVKQMKTQKIKHIILVDDIIASGDRIISYWKSYDSKTVRSWLSAKHCTLNAVVYTADSFSIKRVKKEMKQLREARVVLDMGKNNFLLEPAFESLGSKYGPPDRRGNRSLSGYGGQASNIVFQHGCPNTAPVMLWQRGGGWDPLFPGRAIPPELFACFEAGGDWRVSHRRLIKARQARLAAAIAKRFEERNLSNKSRDLLLALGLLLRNVSVENLATQMMKPQQLVNDLLNHARILGFINPSGEVTAFGRDLVARTRNIPRKKDKTVIGVEEAVRFYYPM